jgi:hypothetical protein
MHSGTPSFELRACRGGKCPRKQTAVLWGRRCVGRECDTWAATGPLSAHVDESNVAVVHFAFAIVHWVVWIDQRAMLLCPIAGLAADVDVQCPLMRATHISSLHRCSDDCRSLGLTSPYAVWVGVSSGTVSKSLRSNVEPP